MCDAVDPDVQITLLSLESACWRLEQHGAPSPLGAPRVGVGIEVLT